MNIALKMGRLIAIPLLFVGFTASVSHAQTPSVTSVNGVACSSAHAVSVAYSAGALNIQTGGCGTAIVLPPPTLPPTITSVLPSSGASGTAITINGTNLAGAVVTVGGAAASVTNNIGHQINTTVPNNAIVGLGSIVATTIAGRATSAFTVSFGPVAAAPVITLVTPNFGSAGNIVTITGTGLNGATVTIGGAAATVTAGSATSIVTSVPGNAPAAAGNVVVTTTGGNTSSPFTVNPPPVGGSDVSVEGITLPSPSKRASTTPGSRGGASGAGPEINAYSMSTTRCSTVPALTKSWQHNIDLANYKNAVDYFVMQSGESLSYKFTVPMEDMSGGFLYNDSATAIVRPTFISVTTAPCHFDASKIVNATRDACFQTSINGNSVNWTNVAPSVAIPISYCRVAKGQTYYFNIRFQDARPVGESGSPTTDSCVSGNCGGMLQVTF